MKIGELKNRIKKDKIEVDSIINRDIAFQIGRQVELARAMRNLTQRQLADLLDTKQSSISRVESGSSTPTISFLMKLADAFQTYLIPPKFAFVEEAKGNLSSFNVDSSTVNISGSQPSLSPYPFLFSGSNDSRTLNRVLFN